MAAYLFQADPDRFDLDRYLLRSLSNDTPVYWLANQHRESMASGDRVFILRSAGNRSAAVGGVIAVGRIGAAPEKLNDRIWDPWGPSGGNDWRVLLDLQELRLTTDSGMVHVPQIVKDPGLAALARTLSANVRLSHEQSEALMSLWMKAAVQESQGFRL